MSKFSLSDENNFNLLQLYSLFYPLIFFVKI